MLFSTETVENLKTRLRTSLTQNNTESLMLIAIEKDIEMKIK